MSECVVEFATVRRNCIGFEQYRNVHGSGAYRFIAAHEIACPSSEPIPDNGAPCGLTGDDKRKTRMRTAILPNKDAEKRRLNAPSTAEKQHYIILSANPEIFFKTHLEPY